MIPLAIEEIEALGLGELHGYGEITGLEIDSRRVGPGDLFVAIRGGREFVGAARDRGAATLVPNDEFDSRRSARTWRRPSGRKEATTPSSACR